MKKRIAIAIGTTVAIGVVATGCSSGSSSIEGPDVVVGHKFADKTLFERTIKANLNDAIKPDRVTNIGCTKTGDTTAKCIVGSVQRGEDAALIEVECSYIGTDGAGHDCMWHEV